MGIDRVAGRGDAVATIRRTGTFPEVHHFSAVAAENAAVVATVRFTVPSGVDPGDVGVLAQTNRDVAATDAALHSTVIKSMVPAYCRGEMSGRVTTDAIQRTRGPDSSRAVLTQVPARSQSGSGVVSALEDGVRERTEIERRELYAGIPWARDESQVVLPER